MRVAQASLAIGVFLLSGTGALAQASAIEGEAPPASSLPGTPPVLAAELGDAQLPTDGRVALSLREAIAVGIERSTDIAVVRVDPALAEQAKRAAWGRFEPDLFAQYDYESSSKPTTNPLEGDLSRSSGGVGGIRGLLPLLGWHYEIAYDGTRLSSNGPLTTLQPEYRANLSGELSMPLLRGAIFGEAWMEVRLARIQTRVALEEFRAQLMDIIADIERSYWTLSAARENLEVARKSLETSRELKRQTEAQLEVGVVSEVEVTEAEAGVADREFRSIQAEADYQAAQDALIDLVFGRALTAKSSLELVLSDAPDAFTRYDTDPEASVARAFEQRPELGAARERVAETQARRQAARNALLPQLDLVASYGTHGIAGSAVVPSICGTPVCTAPTGIPQSYSGTTDYFFEGQDNRTWTGGARFSVPLGNSTARADARSADYQLEKASALLAREEQNAFLTVRNAVRKVRARLAQVDAAERRSAAASEQLRTEQLRLDHGKSTPFDLLQREEDLVEAQFQKIIALRDYRVAVAELDRAQGTTLEAHGVALDTALGER